MPIPAVLVSCGGTGEWRPNLITIAWTGTVCTDPPMLAISVRPDRHSHAIIGATREFAVNVPSAAEVKALDWCGVVSGRDADKFAATGLTPAPALKLGCPIVAECPLNIECRVRRTMELGSHTLFLAEVVAVQVSSDPWTPRTGCGSTRPVWWPSRTGTTSRSGGTWGTSASRCASGRPSSASNANKLIVLSFRCYVLSKNRCCRCI